MPTLLNIHALLLSSAAIGAAFGFVLHRGRFCTMGALADIVAMNEWTRLKTWALAIAIAVAGFQTGSLLFGWHVADTFYAAPRVYWLSHLLGGFLFGLGMVRASGCGSQSLVRMGTGNLKSLVVVVVMSVVGLISLKGILAVLRVDWLNAVYIDLAGGSALFQVTGSAIPVYALAIALAAWALIDAKVRQRGHLLTGLSLGLLATAAWWLTLQAGFVAEHPETLEPVWLGTYSGRPEALTFTAPMAHTLEWLAYFSDGSRKWTMGMSAACGVIAGAFVSARLAGVARFEGFRQVDDLKRHLTGGALMGFGAVLGLGCSIGQGLTGMATVSLGSVLTLAGIVVGAVVQLRRDLAAV